MGLCAPYLLPAHPGVLRSNALETGAQDMGPDLLEKLVEEYDFDL